MAQLVVNGNCNARVVGSIPAGTTNMKMYLCTIVNVILYGAENLILRIN